MADSSTIFPLVATPVVLPSQAAHMIVGRQGEEIAATYLRKLGYRIFAKNVRLRKDEIDIIAFDPGDRVIVFAEVKMRSKDGPYHPSIDATRLKCAKLRRSARAWVRAHQYQGGYRIDLVCVIHDTVVEHVKELEWGEERRTGV